MENVKTVMSASQRVADAADACLFLTYKLEEAQDAAEKALKSYQEALEALRSMLVQDAANEPSEEPVIDHRESSGNNSIENLEWVRTVPKETSWDKVKERVLESLDIVVGGFEWGNLKTLKNLKDELDSLDMIELVMTLEDEFDIEIPDSKAETFWDNKRRVTVDDLTTEICKMVSGEL